MFKKIAIIGLFLTGISCLYAEDALRVGFEQEGEPTPCFWVAAGEKGQIWSKDKAIKEGYIKINYAGITEEKSYTGKKSYKLDITLNGGYVYFSLPLSSKIKVKKYPYISAYMYIEKGADCMIKLGVRPIYTKPDGTKTSGVDMGGYYGPETGFVELEDGWRFYQFDDYSHAKRSCAKSKNGGNPDDVEIDCVSLNIFKWGENAEGEKHIILYLDDVVVSAEKQ